MSFLKNHIIISSPQDGHGITEDGKILGHKLSIRDGRVQLALGFKNCVLPEIP